MTIFSCRDSSQTQLTGDAMERAAACIRRGEVLIFPTETIYGVGCSALQEDAVRRVFEIKGRRPDQPPPILIGNSDQLSTLVARVPREAQALMERHWPGALTLILPARDELSPLLCGWNEETNTRTVGVRLTGHALARALCERSTPLIATSANFSGASGRAAAPQTLDDIPRAFQEKVDGVIDGGRVGGVASTVVDCTGGAPRVLREGAVRDLRLTIYELRLTNQAVVIRNS
jgi:L-threonylcarbamoyladenylate synthase